MDTKHCHKCSKTLPVTAFARNKRQRDGLQSYCKSCCAIQKKLHSAANPGKEALRRKKWRTENPARDAATTKAWKEANPEKRIHIRKMWNKKNAETINERNRAWYAANKEQVALAHKKLRDSFPEKRSEACKRWRANNPDKARTILRKWKSRNPEKVAGYHGIRRAKKNQAIPAWFDQKAVNLVYAKAQEWGNILDIPLQVDHIVPLTSPLVCGLHCTDNLQILAASENASKGNRSWPDMPT